jgi:hypothetical protein
MRIDCVLLTGDMAQDGGMINGCRACEKAKICLRLERLKERARQFTRIIPPKRKKAKVCRKIAKYFKVFSELRQDHSRPPAVMSI